MSAARIGPATAADIPTLQALRRALWPDEDLSEPLPHELTLLARDDGGVPVGFAEGSIRRDYVNGCDTSPVAFLEGLYVAPAHRRQGIARALIAAIADWGRTQGLRELASDALLDNLESHAFHRAAGFAETERVVCFRQPL